jgi:methionine synthase II (cobalamin-independent)
VLERVPGRASGIGSWPGKDVVESARTVFGELPEPHVPYLPELPARGPGADLIGRGAALLVDLPVDLQPSGWRLVDRPGRDLARAQSLLQQDLDVLAEVADGYRGPFKVQVAGPWTLAASLHLVRLERAVCDAGACRDLAASLAEGVVRHVGRIRELVPGAQVVVQLDEPCLPDVLLGRLSTASGFGRLRPVEEPVVAEGLRSVLQAAVAAGVIDTVVHCCAADPPLGTITRAGAGAVSVDVSLLGTPDWESVAAMVEGGAALWAGVVPATGTLPSAQAVADRLRQPWRRIGLPATTLDAVVLTPACGLATATPVGARAVLGRVRDAARVLAERSTEV